MDLKKLFKQELLEQLHAPYKNCTSCPLAKLGRTQVVFGTGNPNAKLMFIGEAPGADEDAQGQPFVGRAGKLLNKALETAGIERDEAYITNIVKCRPPKNRAPLPAEMETCKAILLNKQIKIIQPRVICTLGATAIQGLLNDPLIKISKVHGTKIDYEGTIIIPTYHPAYILRNPSKLKALTNDLIMASMIANPQKTSGG